MKQIDDKSDDSFLVMVAEQRCMLHCVVTVSVVGLIAALSLVYEFSIIFWLLCLYMFLHLRTSQIIGLKFGVCSICPLERGLRFLVSHLFHLSIGFFVTGLQVSSQYLLHWLSFLNFCTSSTKTGYC